MLIVVDWTGLPTWLVGDSLVPNRGRERLQQARRCFFFLSLSFPQSVLGPESVPAFQGDGCIATGSLAAADQSDGCDWRAAPAFFTR
jgi:hypothetical protein